MMESKKIRLVFRRGSLALKIAVLAVVVLSMASLLLVWLYKQDAKKQYEKLRDQAVTLEVENSRLHEAIEDLGTLRGIAKIAREQLGLVDPDTIIIEPEN